MTIIKGLGIAAFVAAGLSIVVVSATGVSTSGSSTTMAAGTATVPVADTDLESTSSSSVRAAVEADWGQASIKSTAGAEVAELEAADPSSGPVKGSLDSTVEVDADVQTTSGHAQAQAVAVEELVQADATFNAGVDTTIAGVIETVSDLDTQVEMAVEGGLDGSAEIDGVDADSAAGLDAAASGKVRLSVP